MDEIVIGYIMENGRIHAIKAWPNYGVVIPSQCTTNGNIPFCAQYLYDTLHYDNPDGSITVTIANEVVTKDWTKQEIIDLLMEEYLMAKQHYCDRGERCIQSDDMK